jgi:hypothetical protein
MLPEYALTAAAISFAAFLVMVVYEFLIVKRKISKFNMIYLTMELLHCTFFILNFAKSAYNLADIVQIISNVCIITTFTLYVAYLYLRTSSMFFGDVRRCTIVKVLSRIAWFFFWIAFIPYFVFMNNFETGDLYFNFSTLVGALAIVCLDCFYVYCFYSFLRSTHGVLHKKYEETEMTIIGRYGIITCSLSFTMFIAFFVSIVVKSEEYNLFVQLVGIAIIVSLFIMKVNVDRFQEKRRTSDRNHLVKQ